MPRRSNRLPRVDLGLGGAVGLEGRAGAGEVGAVLGGGPGAGGRGGGEGVVLGRGVDGVGEPGVPEGFDLGAVNRKRKTRALASVLRANERLSHERAQRVRKEKKGERSEGKKDRKDRTYASKSLLL